MNVIGALGFQVFFVLKSGIGSSLWRSKQNTSSPACVYIKGEKVVSSFSAIFMYSWILH